MWGYKNEEEAGPEMTYEQAMNITVGIALASELSHDSKEELIGVLRAIESDAASVKEVEADMERRAQLCKNLINRR